MSLSRIPPIQAMPRNTTALFMLAFFAASTPSFSQEESRSSNPVRSDPRSLPFEGVDNATRAKWLLDGTVVDAGSGRPIPRFLVTPGTRTIGDRGETQIRWRDNLAKKMSEGLLRWPRTSGFNEMRFKVSADGYLPVITHSIQRGGPHTRLRIKLMPVNPETNPIRRDEVEKRR